MGKKKQNSSLGRTLIKDRFGGKSHRQADSHLHSSELDDGVDWNRLNLQSVTEQNTLDEFLATAQIAGTEFQAERLNVSIVQSEKHTGLLTVDEELAIKQKHEDHRTMLRIPRRPAWDETTTAAELDRAEKDSFLEWRRQLAELQEVEGIVMTPFERNLEFWRQLWRVIERSDVVVQIVDARNPLLFRCEDLEAYVKEINPEKINMLLINKADLLTQKQRQYWAEYFDKKNVKVAFWSAINEAEKLQQNASESGETPTNESDDVQEDSNESDNESDNHSDTEDIQQSTGINEDSDEKINAELSENLASNTITEASKSESLEQSQLSEDSCKSCDSKDIENKPFSSASDFLAQKNNPYLLNGDELVALFKSLHDHTTTEKGITTIGLVGYPNVGKSSTINALLQTKKVPVSATPGRTKHFQTLFLDKTLMLCDCPGLVMPSFVTTKAEMIVCGILPVDQMRDYIPPVSLICRHIPRGVLQATYGILLPRPKVEDGEEPDRLPTAHELLTSYACMRGFMTHKGVPDFQRSSRQIIKDYINGRLLYCHPPLGGTVSVEEFEPAGSVVKTVKVNKMAAKTAQAVQPSSIDADFFKKKDISVGSKGVHGVQDYTRREGFAGHHGSTQTLGDKPWKRHGNKNKKQKLRRLHKDLDA